MDNGAVTVAYLLRLVGFFGVAIGIAWAIQTLGFGYETVGARVMWIVAAAAMSGAGVGLILAAASVPEAKAVRI